MKDSLMIGLVLGFVAGAILVTHNQTAHDLAMKGKRAVKRGLDKL